MARIALGGLTTLNLATHLDPQFVDLYNLRELISSPGYVAATPRMAFDSGGAVSFLNGVTLGDAVGDALTINSHTVSTPNGLTFSGGSGIGISASSSLPLQINSNDPAVVQMYFMANNSLRGLIGSGGTFPSGAATDFGLRSQAELLLGSGPAGTARVRIESAGHTRPAADNTYTLGSGSFRWSVVYAGTGTINTSDAREKTAVAQMTANEIVAAKALAAEIGTFQFLDAIAEKGEANARHHVGMTVQRAIEIMEANNLDPMRYGFICYDAWPERIEPAQFREEREDIGLFDSNNEPIYNITQVEVQPERVIPAGDRYSFRPDELLLFIARGFEARLAALEAAAAA